MFSEHAITIRDQLKLADLEYIVKKANRLGSVGRNLLSIYTETDREGIHIFFGLTGMLTNEERRNKTAIRK